jgi:transcriptional regulator with XRE-family HTH domain
MSIELENLTPGARLRALREQRGLTQEQLGKAVKLHPVVISYFETGQREIGPPSVLKLARFFGVDAFYFVSPTEKILAET